MFLSIFPVWSELDLMTQIYWVITAPATLIFILLVILTIFGSDMDSGVHTGFDSSIADGDSIPFQFLSVKSIVGFFVMFGWSGLGLLSAGVASWLAILLSVICGLLMMLAMASLFYFMSKLTENGTLNMKNAIGKLGEVYLTIPANRKGMGKVQLTVQGSIQTLDAISDDPEAITTSSLIEVLDVIDQQILLVKRNSR
ncbi:MAG: hypothetical protein K0M40_07985 [Prolixibacteraceae bacterium]|nr:hypothetical protein [Prolixibacteraceae bacterium]